MELSARYFTHLAKQIDSGHALWAVLALSRYDCDAFLRTALVKKAEESIAQSRVSKRARAAGLSVINQLSGLECRENLLEYLSSLDRQIASRTTVLRAAKSSMAVHRKDCGGIRPLSQEKEFKYCSRGR